MRSFFRRGRRSAAARPDDGSTPSAAVAPLEIDAAAASGGAADRSLTEADASRRSLADVAAPLPPHEGAMDNEDDGATSDRATAASACAGGFRAWLTDAVWPGMGLFGESYVVFSLGTLEPLWKQIYPDCWGNNDAGVAPTCSARLRQSLTYSVVVGVICGMLLFGPVAARIGRRRGSLATAFLMATGASGLALLGLAFAARARRGAPDDPAAFLTGMAVLLLYFGVGVGGEYPLSASSASERTMEAGLRSEAAAPHGDGTAGASATQRHRGRAVQLVFTMQGMGIFCNALFLTVLLAATGQTGRGQNNAADPYDPAALRAVSNAVYAVGAAVLWYVFISRYRHLRESAAWQDDKAQRTRLVRNQPAIMEAAAAASEAALRASRSSGLSEVVPPVPGSPTTDYRRMTDGRAGRDASVRSLSGSVVSSIAAPALIAGSSCDEASQDTYTTAVRDDLPSDDALQDMQTRPLRLLLRHFGVRLAGVSLCWMLWDVAFYGNKLFQSTFLLALTGEDTTTLLGLSLAATLNALVALCGYFGAAMLLDRVGRFRLQLAGFLLTGALFVAVGFTYERLSMVLLVALYLGTSFFGQLGPNATTFLLPAEVFPTEMRSLCHGLAAAAGKTGALFASIVFGRVAVLDLFLLSGFASILAGAVTLWAVPESNGLDLHELDRKWRLILDGRKAEYDGQANDPRYLSRHERYRRRHRRRPPPPRGGAAADRAYGP